MKSNVKDFETCLKSKKCKIRTQVISKYRYRRLCILDGKTYRSEIKKKLTS